MISSLTQLDLVKTPTTLSFKLNFLRHLFVFPFATIIGFLNEPPDDIVNPKVNVSLKFSLHLIFVVSDPLHLIAVLGIFIML